MTWLCRIFGHWWKRVSRAAGRVSQCRCCGRHKVESSAEWREDCMHWIGRELTGQFAHWCPEWDYLPVDETCDEIACCSCFEGEEFEQAQARADDRLDVMGLDAETAWDEPPSLAQRQAG